MSQSTSPIETPNKTSTDIQLKSPSQNFDVERTKDGSPTLRLKSKTENIQNVAEEKPPESMHHCAGAAAETHYIYGTALKKIFALQAKNTLHILVVGLGLGYIEILAAGINQEFPHIKLKITSYEIDAELKQNFQNWIMGDNNFPIYNKVCRHLGYEPSGIKTVLQNVDLQIQDALNASTVFSAGAHIICFDAFSRKTTQELWSEEFLQYFLSKACDQDCVFATYACTGDLRRALGTQGFTVIKRAGFTEKRNSTLALRGLFA